MVDRRTFLAGAGVALGLAGGVGTLAGVEGSGLAAAVGALVAAAGALVPWAGTHLDGPAGAAQSAGRADPRPAPGQDPLAHAGERSGPPLLTDPGTGLFSEAYFDVAIEARIAAARRHLRPVGVVLLEVIEGLRSGQPQPTEPLRVAHAIRETLREADTACRRADGLFALLLEDTPENGAIWTVERVRRGLVDQEPGMTMWAGIACYPAHGFDSEALISQAELALANAREWRQDRIEVAVVPD